MSERLIVVSGPMQGTKVEVNDQEALSIGRSHENGLQINDLQVSRKHAVVQRTAAGVIVRDLGSGNGTFVGERRILEYKLANGDIFTVGPVQIRFEADEDGTMAASGAQSGSSSHPAGSPKTAPGQSVVFDQKDESNDRTLQAATAASVYQTFFDTARQTSGAADQLRKAQNRLAAVYEATQIITSEQDINKLLSRVMDQLFELVPAHNGVLVLKDDQTGELRTECVRTGSGQSEIVISTSIVRRAAENGEAIITFNAAADDRFEAGMSIIAQNITSAMCAPLEHQEEILGALYVDTRGTSHAFAQSDLELMVALARAAAIAIRNAQYLAQVEQGYNDTITVLANAIEMRDHYTVGHTWRVTRFSIEIGRELGWDEEKLAECERGGILHDVGKIAVDNAILGKAARLTEDEYAKIKIHPERGARMMQDVDFLIPLIPYALYHHERWDGKGYPYGLHGEAIPIEGRVVAVADTLDAMTSNRPYRKGMDPEVAIAKIQEGSGTQFDPRCVDALVSCHKAGRINKVLQNYFETDRKSVACPFCSTFIRMPDDVESNTEFSCSVCHRPLLLRFQNDAWFAELLSASELAQQGANRFSQEITHS